jgi:hypothetical protein
MTISLWKAAGRLLLLSLLFAPSLLHAQFRCGFDGVMKGLRNEHPGYEEGLNKKVKEFIARRKLSSARTMGLQATLYYIPVVVHVIHTGGGVGSTYNPTDATIQGAIDYLNAVYNGTWNGAGGSILGAGDIGVQFVLATKDPSGAPTTGINRVDGRVLSWYEANGIPSYTSANELQVKSLSRWDPSVYYNVWVVNRIDGADGTAYGVPFTAGYAYFPMPNTISADNRRRDGIVMLASQMRAGEKTLPHEIGHALALLHPFETGSDATDANGCVVNTSPYTQGDYCQDTDPVINPADSRYGASAFSCRTGTNPCTGTPYSDNTEKNFMNYTFCYQLFTNDQKARMQAALEYTNREGLADSWTNNQGAYPVSWSAPGAPTVTPASLLVYNNAFGITSVGLNGKRVYSLSATQDGGYVDNTKWYNLFSLQPSTTYTMDVGLLNVGNYDQVGVWIDYNGDGAFNDAEERVFYADAIPTTERISFPITTPSALPGGIVRMRVMNDGSYTTYGGFTPLNGASTSTRAGQAEDYPVFLLSTTPMPVTLLDFSGRTAAGNTLLTWTTAQEENAREYQVQRSTDGSTFTTVGVVAAKGNTSTETAYRFTDYTAGSGTHFYRLKMVDQNETFRHSPVVQITTEAPLDVRVSGNPFSHQVRITLPDHQGPVSLRLLDATGKVYLHRTPTATQASTISLEVDPSLSKGLYILEVVADGKRSVHKLVKE